MELHRLARPKGCLNRVSSQATDGARQAVGMHHGPTRTPLADYSLRHRRDGNAGSTILYHLRTTGRLGHTWQTTAYAIGGTATLALRYHIRICRRPHSS